MKNTQDQFDLRRHWARLATEGPKHLRFWVVGLCLGIVAGFAAVGFRLSVSMIQRQLYGADERSIISQAMELHWGLIFALPICGGLLVGLILHRFTDDGRARSVADTIEGAALNRGRVGAKEGLASTLASMITLSSGGSSGREGPVVHLAGVLSTWVANRLDADGITARDLMGCAVAAAVSASFNAPIAGALFALEVILRHFAMNAFAPIVIASVAGAVVSRLTLGDVTEFSLPTMRALEFYVELPAFLILGLLSGLLAVVMMVSIFWADSTGTHLSGRFGIPRWLRPAFAGAFLGGIAIFYPHIIGVGYETISDALSGQLLFHEAVVFVIVKCAAVAITMGGRMGGGVFSPSLMVGALFGLAFGMVATSIFPNFSGTTTIYALAGMGAVAAAVLGAPISTTLIVFELTGDWQTGLAVMVAVSISTAIASRMVRRSFFITQLENRGVHIAEGPQAYLLSLYRVGMVMRPFDEKADTTLASRLRAQVENGLTLSQSDTLEDARALIDAEYVAQVPVVENVDGTPIIQGVLYQIDVLKVFSRALAAAAAEEHR